MSKILKYDYITVIDAILSLNEPLSLSLLRRTTGFDKHKLVKLLKRIRKYFWFTIKFNWNLLGVRRLVLILDRVVREPLLKDYLTVQSQSFSGHYFLVYMVPNEYIVNTLVENYSPILTDFILLEKPVYPSYRLSNFFNRGKITVKEGYLRLLRDKTTTITSKDNRTIKITELDLKILDIIMKNPLIFAHKIAEKLDEPQTRIKRRLILLFKRGIISGYFLGGTNILGKLLFGIVIRIKLSDINEAYSLTERVSMIFPFSISFYNSDGEVILNLPVYKDTLQFSEKVVKIIKNSYDNTEIYVMMRRTRHVFNPLLRVYDKYTRSFEKKSSLTYSV